MIRRKFIKFVIALGGTSLLIGDFLAPLFAATSLKSPLKTAKYKSVPITNLNNALKSSNPDAVAKFVLSYQSSAKKASTSQKIKLLRKMKVKIDQEGYARNGLRHGDYESSVLILLRGTEKEPGQLAQIIQGKFH